MSGSCSPENDACYEQARRQRDREFHEVGELVAMVLQNKGVKGKSGALSGIHVAYSLMCLSHLF